MSAQPLVSVVIANWNGGKVFENCLESLSKIDYRKIELVVIDNGSSDGSEVLPRKYFKKAKLIKSKSNLGFALANNQGYKKAKGEYVLLLNNDTRVDKKFLSRLVARLEEDISIGVIQPKIFMMEKRGYLDNAGSFFTKIGFLEHWGFGRKDAKEFSKETDIFSAKGACMLIRKEVIERVDLFDRDFVSYFEESDFCWRVWIAGWRVVFYPDAKIYHKVGFTIKRLDVGNINYHYYKNRINSLIKNLDLFNLALILPVHLFISLGIALAFLVRGKREGAFMIFRAVAWNVYNFKHTLRKRNVVQKKRRASDGDIFGRLSRPVSFSKFYQDFRRVERDMDTGQPR